MIEGKHVLLIGGGGTLGLYTAQTLLEKGCRVDILCLNEPELCHENLQIIQQRADYPYLQEFLSGRYYDGIVNYLHYEDVENYKPVHQLLCARTDHLIFLSSYRIYGDSRTPITEQTPTLLHSSNDEAFLKHKNYYALTKTLAEDYMRTQSGTKNWTAVRPVISFSSARLDLITRSRQYVYTYAQEGKVMELPVDAKNVTAGLDWAGNSGKLIANLLFKPETFGQAYTISSAQNLTWGQVADIYAQLLGLQIRWVDTRYYLQRYHEKDPYILCYDRLFDRKINNTKVLKATGLTDEDFVPIRDAIAKVKSGELGTVISVEAHMSAPHTPKVRQWLEAFPGGMMFFLGCHLVDLVMQIQGKPLRVTPFNRSTATDGVTAQDFGMAVLEYPNGVSFVKTNAHEPGGFARRQLVITGTKATLELKPLEMKPPEATGDNIRVTDTVCYDNYESWMDRGVFTPGEQYHRYQEMMESFARMVAGEMENPCSCDYELELFKLVLQCCGTPIE